MDGIIVGFNVYGSGVDDDLIAGFDAFSRIITFIGIAVIHTAHTTAAVSTHTAPAVVLDGGGIVGPLVHQAITLAGEGKRIITRVGGQVVRCNQVIVFLTLLHIRVINEELHFAILGHLGISVVIIGASAAGNLGMVFGIDPAVIVIGIVVFYRIQITIIGETDIILIFIYRSHLGRVVGILIRIITLMHEADHVWKYKWTKIPIGILSIYFIYYCMIDCLWWIIETAFCLSAEVSACGTLISAIASAAVVAIGYRNTKYIRTVSYRIPLSREGNNFRVVLISDLHLGAFVGVAHVSRIVNAINHVKPDLIVIAGDLIDDDHSVLSEADRLKCISSELRRLKSTYGTVLTLGNHDPDTTDPAFHTFLDESDIILLHNHVLKLPAVNVIGISDPTHNKRIPLSTLLVDRNPTKPTIVIDHDPQYMDVAVEQKADLILSGHTHAGQFFPASILTRIALDKHRFYGHHKVGSTHAVVTSGAGFFNLPTRIGTHNEIVEIVL